MSQSNIVMIGLDKDLSTFISSILQTRDYTVNLFLDEVKAIENIRKNQYDLYIIENTINHNKIHLCRLIRQEQGLRVPILILSDKYDEFDLVSFFEAGADDFMSRPIRPRELIARVTNLIRRSKYHGNSNIVYVNDIYYNRTTDKVSINNKEILLTQTEQKLLKILIDHAGEPVSSKKILNEVWGWNDTNGTAVVATNINRLRKKIGANKIITVKGRGYKLEN